MPQDNLLVARVGSGWVVQTHDGYPMTGPFYTRRAASAWLHDYVHGGPMVEPRMARERGIVDRYERPQDN
jgi:hypothetical protein